MMQDAISEIDEFCEKNSWLNEIYHFCCDWNEDSVLEWKGKAAFSIEVSSICVNKCHSVDLEHFYLSIEMLL